MSSNWEQLDIDNIITRILDVQSHKPQHHFGRPFLTPYQIVIKLQQFYPHIAEAIGKPPGGKGTGQRDFLARYIALEFSRRIKDNRITHIDGRFLYHGDQHSLQFGEPDQVMESSTGQSSDLSIFRLRD